MEVSIQNAYRSGMPVVLLVEDNPDDVLLTRRAINKAGLQVSLSIAADGDEAVAYLQAAGDDSNRNACPLPALILLDLKLPKRSGLEVLQWIRLQPALARVPVVVLTSSTEEDDIATAYASGANSYLQKPVAFTGLVQLLGVLNLYWLETNVTSSRTGTSN